jgi:hypothetical protein
MNTPGYDRRLRRLMNGLKTMDSQAIDYYTGLFYTWNSGLLAPFNNS